MSNNPFFRIGLGILIFCVIIYMLEKISFIFEPIIILVKTLSLPFIIAGVLYYLLLPLFNFLQRKGIKKNLSILTIYSGLALIISLFFVFIGPLVMKQIKNFTDKIPLIANSFEEYIKTLSQSELAQSLHLQDKLTSGKLTELVVAKANDFMMYASENFINILSTISGLMLLLITVPFILFYLLKDGDKIPNLLTKGLSSRNVIEARRILSELNFALSSYIQGQILVSIIVGVLVYIGYLIIGLDFALLMALIAMVTNLIPFAGPFIGLGIALVVGLMQSFHVGLLVCLVVLIVQQIESNFISPQIIGSKLQIHPLTILLLLLFAGKLAGFVGLLLAVPIYAVSKVVLINAKRIWNIKKRGGKLPKTHPDFDED